MRKLFYFLLLIPLIGISQTYNPVGYTSHKGLKISPVPTTEITTATKVLVLDANGIFRLSKPNIGVTALDTLTVNPYFGIRLKPKDATVSGFHIEKSINGAVGYTSYNYNDTGNGAIAHFTVRGTGTGLYDNYGGLYHYNGAYGITSLRNTIALTSDRIISIWNYGDNAAYIDFLTGGLTDSTSKLRIFKDGQLKLGVQPTLATNNDDLVSINSTGNITKTKKLELQETDNAETLYFSGQDSSDISGAKRLSYGKTPDYAQIDYYNVAHNTILEDYVLEAGDLDNFLINDGVITFNYVLGKYYDSENDTDVTFQAELYENTTATSPFAISELSEVLGVNFSYQGKLKSRVVKKYIAAGQRLMVKIRVFYANTAITQNFVTTHGSNLGTDNSNLSMFELPINRKHHISQTIANDITALVPSVDAVYDFVKSEVASIPTPEANVSGGTETFFFTGETDDLAGIKTLNPTKQPLASQISSFLNDVQNNVVEETYVFKLDADHPHYIPKGIGKIYFKAVKTLGDKEAKLKFTLRKFKDGVVNETFATSEESLVITTSDADYEVTFPILNNIIIDAQNGESIRIDVIPTYTTGTTETDLIIKMMGTTGTRLVIPIDDTSPITQDLTIGLKNVAPSSDKVTQALDLKQDKPVSGSFANTKNLMNFESIFFSSGTYPATGRYMATVNYIQESTFNLEITGVTNGQVVYEMATLGSDYSNRNLPDSYATTTVRATIFNAGSKKLNLYCEVYELDGAGNLKLLSTDYEKTEITTTTDYYSFSTKVSPEFIESNNTLVFKYKAEVTGEGNDPNLRILIGNSQGSRVLLGSDRATGVSRDSPLNVNNKDIATSPFQVNQFLETRIFTFRFQDRYGVNNYPIPSLTWANYTFRNIDSQALNSYQRSYPRKENGEWIYHEY